MPYPLSPLKSLCLLCAVQLVLPAPALAAPPPWAPAHGYYKPKNKYKPWAASEAYLSPYVIDGRCNREGLGAVLGGVIGGVAGSQVGKGDGRAAATIVGTLVGAFVGSSVGRSMDQADAACVGQALEYGDPGAPLAWTNPDTDAQYRVTPTRTYQQDGNFCREFTREAMVGGKREEMYGTACRQADGSWRIVP